MPCCGPNSCARCQDPGASSAPCCCRCCHSCGLAPLHWGCHLCVLSPQETQPRLASLCWHGCKRGPSCFPRTVLPWDKAALFSGGTDKAALTGSTWQAQLPVRAASPAVPVPQPLRPGRLLSLNKRVPGVPPPPSPTGVAVLCAPWHRSMADRSMSTGSSTVPGCWAALFACQPRG